MLLKDSGNFFFPSRRRHTSWNCDWSSDVCSSVLCPTPSTWASFCCRIEDAESHMYGSASSILQQKLAQVEGVGQVTVGGGALPAVRVDVNPMRSEERRVRKQGRGRRSPSPEREKT